MPFQPGQSGNPAGRPRGARNQMTMIVEELLAGNAEALTRKLIDQAQAGNPASMALLARSLLRQRKGTFIRVDLPELEKASDAPTAVAAIYAAVCAGQLVPADGNALIRMVEAFVRITQKTGNADRRPERDKTAELVAAKMRDRPQPQPLHQCEAHATTATVPATDAQTGPGEPGIDEIVEEALRGSFAHQPGSLPRLRREILGTTSPIVERSANPGGIVSHCRPRATPAGSRRNGHAT
jgi:hypothetical protein